MNERLHKLFQQANEWCAAGRAAGWFDASDSDRFSALEAALPSDLFAAGAPRPLVVAFFGGTGVGKSSLLNRLAGSPIARTGVVRPTSHEVTVYLHEDVSLASLPPGSPVDKVAIHRHGDARQRDVAWIDAPDINSTSAENRALALAWTPYIDLIVYVVSPERYRDDVGWRILQERGGRHGWLFVMNRWDEGREEQSRDFKSILRDAGFESPVILCSCGASDYAGRASIDEFPQIVSTIRSLVAEHGTQELERLGHRARLLDLLRELSRGRARLGDDAAWAAVLKRSTELWLQARTRVINEMELGQRMTADRLVAFGRTSPVAWLSHVRSAITSSGTPPVAPTPVAPQDIESEISSAFESAWPPWARERFEGFMDSVDLELSHAGLRKGPVRQTLEPVINALGKDVQKRVSSEIRAVLARPASPLRDRFRRFAGFCTKLLPTLALIWVAVQVVIGFYRATLGTAGYLGFDFVANSAALLLISWALPFAAWYWLRPNLVSRLLKVQRRALIEAFDQGESAFTTALQQSGEQARLLRERGQELERSVQSLADAGINLANPGIARLVQTRSAGAPVGAARNR